MSSTFSPTTCGHRALSVPSFATHAFTHPPTLTLAACGWGEECVWVNLDLWLVTVSHHQRAVLIPPLSYSGFLSYFIVNIFNNWQVLPSNSSTFVPLLLAFPHFALTCPLCQPPIRLGHKGSMRAHWLLRGSSSRWILTFLQQDGENWAGQVLDRSPAGWQTHRLALIKKAPPLCSHRRWM